MNAAMVVGGILVVLVLVGTSSHIRIAREYERGVVFRLGRLIALKGPALFFKYPGVDRVTMRATGPVTTLVAPG